jgi:hypothetical protein
LALGDDKNSSEQTRFQTRIGIKDEEGIRLRSTPKGKFLLLPRDKHDSHQHF